MVSSIVRFRPTGPWRFGPDSGGRERVDFIYHSDSLYAAVTSAMLGLGFMEEWLDATARGIQADPEVRFSSLFPFHRDILFVTPPRSLWPPPPSTKIRYKSARFVPLAVVRALVEEQRIDENRWTIDGESQCMIAPGEAPFRIGLRTAAAVDRLNAASTAPHTTACLEFARDAGLWTLAAFATEEARERWEPRVTAAFRLLADSGLGGERSRGWGRSAEPEWRNAPEFWAAPEGEKAYWLLSLYAPAERDGVDWKSGDYATVTRTGRVESAENWGALKNPTLMIIEGSVLVCGDAPRGAIPNVAPDGFPNAVYRAGFAVAIAIPWRAPGTTAAQKPAGAAKAPREDVGAGPITAPERASETPVEAESQRAEQGAMIPPAAESARPKEADRSSVESSAGERAAAMQQREAVVVEAESGTPGEADGTGAVSSAEEHAAPGERKAVTTEPESGAPAEADRTGLESSAREHAPAPQEREAKPEPSAPVEPVDAAVMPGGPEGACRGGGCFRRAA